MATFKNDEQQFTLIPADLNVAIVIAECSGGVKAGSSHSKHPGRSYDWIQLKGVILNGEYKGRWIKDRIIAQVERTPDGPVKYGWVKKYTDLREALGLEKNEVADTDDDVNLLATEWIGKVTNATVSQEEGFGNNEGKKFNSFKTFELPSDEQKKSLVDAYKEWEDGVKADSGDTSDMDDLIDDKPETKEVADSDDMEIPF